MRTYAPATTEAVLADLLEEPSLAAWNRFCAKLAAAGLARAPHEGPLDYLRRVQAARPRSAEEAREITQRYVKARYGEGASRAELRELARRVREFKPSWPTSRAIP